MKNPLIWIVVILIIIFGGWYAWTMSHPTPVDTTGTVQQDTTGQATMGTDGTTQASGNATLNVDGKRLVAANGMTLYIYSKDTPGVSNCTGTCAANWPPYTVGTGVTLASTGGLAGPIATTKRADGSTQVTYKGMPLYFWVGDKDTTQATGGGVNDFLVAIP